MSKDESALASCVPARRGVLRALAGGAALAAAGGLLSGCQGFGVPRSLHYGVGELQDMLARQCPLRRRVLEVVDLTLTNPRVAVQPGEHRLWTAFDLAAEDRLFGGRADARLSLAYGLRYEPSDRSLRLQDVRVLSLEVASGGAALHGRSQRVGELAAELLLEGRTLWRMKPDLASRLDAVGVAPQGVRVDDDGVTITLGPKAS